MTIEVSLLLSGVSIAFAIFFGISTRNRNVKKDTQDEAREDATILTKLEKQEESAWRSTAIQYQQEGRKDARSH